MIELADCFLVQSNRFASLFFFSSQSPSPLARCNPATAAARCRGPPTSSGAAIRRASSAVARSRALSGTWRGARGGRGRSCHCKCAQDVREIVPPLPRPAVKAAFARLKRRGKSSSSSLKALVARGVAFAAVGVARGRWRGQMASSRSKFVCMIYVSERVPPAARQALPLICKRLARALFLVDGCSLWRRGRSGSWRYFLRVHVMCTS